MTSTATRIPSWITSTITAIEGRTITREADAGRYPRIYAHEYIRSHADAFGVPPEVSGSHYKIRDWLRGHLGIRDPKHRSAAYTAVLVELADAYLREHLLELPDDVKASRIAADSTPE